MVLASSLIFYCLKTTVDTVETSEDFDSANFRRVLNQFLAVGE